ncbi:error-prone DNA polymerase, DnaE-like [Paracoccus aminovorans]|uniref:Error-prone DNA polymerase n=1 Tax=Paracoccus aminovorans TaxID=34004 RepID=A0A1I3AST7_9RHOB|nr:error-prone DNA polymerase [Paracoccus aminovorans]CQR86523.1 DNA polymerase III, alpha subunit [Paracoccus aminovorans]SFH53188.1 error-prone DNA polymerase, DnaE-like [Paracoccus aminovorans]
MPDHHPRNPDLLPEVQAPNPPADYVELAVTSAFSFQHGASHPRELALAAHLLGYDAVGIADLNSLAGVVRLHATARKLHLRPVIGARIVLACGTAFLAYPTDRAAYGRLAALITKGRRADLDGKWQKKGRCDLSLDDLAAHAEGLRLIWLPGEDLAPLPGLAARLPQLSHVAASWLYRGDDRARINRLDRAARAAGLSIVAVNDVHYHAPDRRPLQDVMTCIREGTTIARAGLLLAQNAERHLKPPAEMVRLFSDWPHAIRATREIADSCRFSLDQLQYEYPCESVPAGLTPQQHLENLTWQGAAWRYPAGVPEKVRATLEKELALIGDKKIAQYFLTIHDIVRFAESRAILHQGRGSAANSAVCYVLGITPVDPNVHELLFERFISQNRQEPPDIDVDFEHERREEVIQHIYDTYGRDHAGLCATVIHYRPRSAIREVGKVMGLSEDVTSALADTVWGSWGDSMKAASTDQAGLDLADPLMRRTVKLAEEMIGMPRHLSQHVGGFILTEGPLSETVPIGNAAMPDRSFIEWDKDDIDELRILKVDVLALGMLTCIRKCFALIEAHYHKTWTLANIPHCDKTYAMLQRGDSIGTFQVESRAQMAMLPRLKPKEFYDLVIQVAIVRPGPIQGNMVHPYLRRRAGLEKPDYPGPRDGNPDELKNILFRTEGVPIFQEQAMKIAMVAAQFTPHEVDELRKAMATFRSRGTIGALEDKMVGRMVERGYDRDFAERCFNQIKGFGDYGFPESHAAAFAHLAYVSAWLKCHYPAAFAAALLNSQPMGFYAPAQIVRDARDHGVTVRPADVNISDWDNRLEACDGGFAMRLGLRQIDGLSEPLARRIKQARDDPDAGPYADLADLKTRARLDARAVRLIAAADALRSMGLDRRAGLWQARALRDAPELPLFGRRDEGAEPAVALPAMPLAEHVTADYQTLRLSLKAHPMAFLRRSMQAQGYVSAAGLAQLPNRAQLRMAGIVLVRQRPGSANGVCFITLEDETGVANLVLWRDTFAAFRKVAMTARLLEVRGQVQRAEGVTHMVAHWLGDRSEALLRLAGEATPDLPAPRAGHPRRVRLLPGSRDFH